MNGFDKLAGPYRWMEYLSFGRALERCRFLLLPELHEARSLLLLGDGDGRFAARALTEAGTAHAVALDGSDAMLCALRRRCEAAGVAQRLTTQCADLRTGLPQSFSRRPFDGIATHFFLDCLTDAEAERIVANVTESAAPHALWIVSEFAVPERGAMRLPSRAVVRMLYLGFRVLTGLQPQQLPQYRHAMLRSGWCLRQQAMHLRGLLVSELWQRTLPEGIESEKR